MVAEVHGELDKPSRPWNFLDGQDRSDADVELLQEVDRMMRWRSGPLASGLGQPFEAELLPSPDY